MLFEAISLFIGMLAALFFMSIEVRFLHQLPLSIGSGLAFALTVTLGAVLFLMRQKNSRWLLAVFQITLTLQVALFFIVVAATAGAFLPPDDNPPEFDNGLTGPIVAGVLAAIPGLIAGLKITVLLSPPRPLSRENE